MTATFSTTTVKIKVTYTDSNNLSVEKEIPVSYERYCGGLGTFDSPYLLCDKESFVGITSDDITEKYFALTADINLTGVGEALGSSSECFIYGENGNVNYHFNSYIDGRNHTVSNYTCTTSSTSNQYGIGLFQKVNDPTYGDSSYSFKDITFDHFSITAAAATWVGALAGGGATTFKNVKITNAAITGKTSVGGFIGFSEGSEIIDSSYSGTVNGNTTTGQNVGGFIGRIGSTGSCKNSSFSGTVTAATNTGGLFGIILGGNVDGDGNPLPTNPKIQDCTFVAGSTVTGTSKVGGIVGTISVNSSIDGAKSYGSVVATTGTSGGICGDCSAPIANVTVQILDNNGNVHATNGVKSNGFLYAGGIAGTLAGSGSITNATVKARIYALAGAAGGIAGSSGGAISGSRFEGVVTGGGSLGGILGLASSSFGTVSNATVTNLTISGTSNLAGGIVGDAKGTISGANLTLSIISGTHMEGGIAGRSTAAIDNNSVASTTVTGTDKVGVIIGTTTSTTSGNSWTPGSFTCSTNCNPTP